MIPKIKQNKTKLKLVLQNDVLMIYWKCIEL